MNMDLDRVYINHELGVFAEIEPAGSGYACIVRDLDADGAEVGRAYFNAYEAATAYAWQCCQDTVPAGTFMEVW